MVLRCPTYSQAVKWARLECKSYKIPEPDIDFPDSKETDDLPLFLRSRRSTGLATLQETEDATYLDAPPPV